MPDPTSTQALLQRVQTGDSQALNDLYNRYLMRVLAAVRARLGAELRGKLESWDIVQDALLASLKHVQSFDLTSEGAFLNWLAKIVENGCSRSCTADYAAKPRVTSLSAP